MDSTDLVNLLLRWAHVLAAIAAFGGLLFARFGVVPALAEVDAATRDRILADVASFVSSQVRTLPDFLRYPYRLALLAFEWLPILCFGRPFVGLDPVRRRAYLDLWTDAPLKLMRNFVKLLRSCTLLAYYDHPELQAALRSQLARPMAPPLAPYAAATVGRSATPPDDAAR